MPKFATFRWFADYAETLGTAAVFILVSSYQYGLFDAYSNTIEFSKEAKII
jgi:hypothetical protein